MKPDDPIQSSSWHYCYVYTLTGGGGSQQRDFTPPQQQKITEIHSVLVVYKLTYFGYAIARYSGKHYAKRIRLNYGAR